MRALFRGCLCTMLHVLAVVAVLAVSVHSGEAIRCYVCSSRNDPGCKDPFNKDHNYHKMVECSHDSMRNIGDLIPGIYFHANYHDAQPQDFACVKAVTNEYEREEVVRSCTIPRPDTFDVCSQLKSRHLSFCKTCSGDLCNGAESAGPRALLLLPALGVLARAW